MLFEAFLGDGDFAVPEKIAVHPVLTFAVEDLVIGLECVWVFKTIAHSMCNDDQIEKLGLLEEWIFLSWDRVIAATGFDLLHEFIGFLLVLFRRQSEGCGRRVRLDSKLNKVSCSE